MTIEAGSIGVVFSAFILCFFSKGIDNFVTKDYNKE